MTRKTNPNMPAGAVPFMDGTEMKIAGMTTRETMAMAALQGLLSNIDEVRTIKSAAILKGADPTGALATLAVRLADALIKALNE